MKLLVNNTFVETLNVVCHRNFEQLSNENKQLKQQIASLSSENHRLRMELSQQISANRFERNWYVFHSHREKLLIQIETIFH